MAKLTYSHSREIIERAVEAGLETIDEHLSQHIGDEGLLDRIYKELRESHERALASSIETHLWHSGSITPLAEGEVPDA